ncbi:RNA methyltransferase [Oscillospiraceae bacterium WX1]
MTEIKSRKNPIMAHFKKLGADGDYRRACCEFVCDGGKLLNEAIAAGAEIHAVITSGKCPDALPDAVPVYFVTPDIIRAISPLKNPQNVIFSCAIPAMPSTIIAAGTYIILDGVQDPGNVGTVIRTADAFKMDGVILTGGCCDLYNPKTVRATMGALFRQRVVLLEIGAIAALKAQGLALYGAALGGVCRDVRTVSLQNAAIAVGSEGGGLSQALLDLCDARVMIPMAPNSESLNAAVAAAILMWEANKHLFSIS